MRTARTPSARIARRIAGYCAGVVLSALALQACAAPPPRAIAGKALDAYLESAVTASGYVGLVAVVADDDAILYERAFGNRDLTRRDPMTPDAIFRIYSMTKPIVSAAALMLADEGRIGLDAPVSAYLPAFAQARVMAADGGLRAPARPMTVRHLLTHTSGLAVGDGPTAALREATDPESASDLADYVARLARVPLAHDPGTVFAYDGTATQVLSRIVEVVSGQSLGGFLRARLFEPLGMRDTGFVVAAAQRHRVVDITTVDDDGRLRIADGPSAARPGEALNAYESGAGGLYSTAADYLRFCRMLLAGGERDGRRYLRAETVAAMMRNQLGHLARPHTSSSEHEGFGFGLSVQLDPAARGRLGAAGQVGWSGAASTHFSIDPQRRLVAIVLAQHLPRGVAGDPPRLAVPFFDLVQRSVTP